jgi:hypothetical protein
LRRFGTFCVEVGNDPEEQCVMRATSASVFEELSWVRHIFEKETAAFFGRGLAFGDPGIRLSPSRKVPQNRRAEETVGPLEFGDPPEVL